MDSSNYISADPDTGPAFLLQSRVEKFLLEELKRAAKIKISRWPGLNRRPTAYKAVALPLSHIGNCH